MPRFHVSFWLSHILVYLFYLNFSLCPSQDISKIDKQGYGLDRKEHGNAVMESRKNVTSEM